MQVSSFPLIGYAQDDLVGKTEKFVNALCAVDKFSGAVLVANGNHVLFEKACGEASKRFHIPNNIDTKFNLGSMNKMFTSIAILQLVERGDLQLEETIDRHIDESWLPKNLHRKSQYITFSHTPVG